MEWETSQLKD